MRSIVWTLAVCGQRIAASVHTKKANGCTDGYREQKKCGVAKGFKNRSSAGTVLIIHGGRARRFLVKNLLVAGLLLVSIVQNIVWSAPSKQDTLAAIETIWTDCATFLMTYSEEGRYRTEITTGPVDLTGPFLRMRWSSTIVEPKHREKQEFVVVIDLSDIDANGRVKNEGNVDKTAPLTRVYLDCLTYNCVDAYIGPTRHGSWLMCDIISAQRILAAINHLSTFYPRRKPPAF